MTLKIEMIVNVMFVPSSSCSCVGSVATSPVKAPTERPSPSNQATVFEMMFWKYSRRYAEVICYELLENGFKSVMLLTKATLVDAKPRQK